MILKGASGKDAEIPIDLFVASTGAAITGYSWNTGDVKVSLPGVGLANAQVANIVEKGLGHYALQLTALETATTGGIQLVLMDQLIVGGPCLQHSWDEVIIASAGAFDTTPPVVTALSPTPGATPGTGGAFSATPATAAATPIVVQLVDASPGLGYYTVVARFYSGVEGVNPVEETVYRHGAFRGLYAALSSSAPSGGGVALTCARQGGWLFKGPAPHIVLAIDAMDLVGNTTSLEFDYKLPAAAPLASGLHVGPIAFYDNAGALKSGLTFHTASNEVYVSKDGVAWTAAANDAREIGNGFYDYPASDLELAGLTSYLAVKLVKATYTTPGEKRRYLGFGPTANHIGPIAFRDNAGALLAGITFHGGGTGEVFLSKDGVNWVAASGNATEIGNGYYDYPASPDEMAGVGSYLAVRLIKATYNSPGEDERLFGGVPSSVSYASLTTPGVLNVDPTTARWTPVVMRFNVPPGNRVAIIARVGVTSAIWPTIYSDDLGGYGGGDAGGQLGVSPMYSNRTVVTVTGTIATGRDFTISIIPNGGWQRPNIAIVPFVGVEVGS